MTDGAARSWDGPPAGRTELRRFGVTVAAPLALLAGWLLWHGRLVGGGSLLLLAVAFAGLAVVQPAVLRPVHAAWMALAGALGWVNAHLLLGLVFYTLFTGVGLAMRLLGRDPLHRRFERQQPSYWRRREVPLPPAEHFERQF